MEAELPSPEGPLKMIEKLGPEQPAQNADGKEEAGPARNPGGAVWGKATAGDHAVDVGMMLKGLAPGVQHGKEAEFGSQVLRVRCDLAESLRGGAEQKGVEELLVLQRESRDLLRDGEHDVEVLDGEDLLLAVGEPFGAGQFLALGTVSVPAGVVGDPKVAAGITAFDVTAARRGATRHDVIQHPSFGGRDPSLAVGGEAGSVGANDVGQL